MKTSTRPSDSKCPLCNQTSLPIVSFMLIFPAVCMTMIHEAVSSEFQLPFPFFSFCSFSSIIVFSFCLLLILQPRHYLALLKPLSPYPRHR